MSLFGKDMVLSNTYVYILEQVIKKNLNDNIDL